LFAGGRYSCSSQVPANAAVSQTLPVLTKNKPSQSVYTYEISQRAPSALFMKELVDSLSWPMAS
jgi:hypothetical protein